MIRDGATGRIAPSHGMFGTPTYRSWSTMKVRCQNPHSHDFVRYGGRGIKVCKRWQRFENFLEDMGPRPEGTTLDRINNDGDYRKVNCRWATAFMQNRNKRTTRLLTHAGKTQCTADWARELGLSVFTLNTRLRRWPVGRALTQPVRRRMA